MKLRAGGHISITVFAYHLLHTIRADYEKMRRDMMRDSSQKKKTISQMFSDIRKEYDFINRIISFRSDRIFRNIAIKKVTHLERVLDICAGTGDMTISLLMKKSFKGRVVLCDFNYDMLSLADSKLQKLGLRDRIDIVIGDAEELPFKDKSFNAIIMGFALRNLESIDAFGLESKRVIDGKGKVVLLDVAHPENRVVAFMFHLYFYKIAPILSRFFTKNKYAYQYLPQSLKTFYNQKDLISKFKGLGFTKATYQNMLWGISAIYKLRR